MSEADLPALWLEPLGGDLAPLGVDGCGLPGAPVEEAQHGQGQENTWGGGGQGGRGQEAGGRIQGMAGPPRGRGRAILD